MTRKGNSDRDLLLHRMTWPEVRKALQRTRMILIPIGSTENQGPHLPLGSETDVAFEIAKRGARDVGAVVAPPLYLGFSAQHLSFPGTISLPSEVLAGVVRHVCKSLHKHGFTRLVIVNGHAGNTPILQTVASDLKYHDGISVAVMQWFSMIPGSEIKKIVERVYHAGEAETSLMLAVDEEAVDLTKAVSEIPKSTSEFFAYDFYAPGPKVIYPYRIGDLTKSGTVGNATKASKEKGEKLLELAVKYLVAFLLDFERGKLPSPP